MGSQLLLGKQSSGSKEGYTFLTQKSSDKVKAPVIITEEVVGTKSKDYKETLDL